MEAAAPRWKILSWRRLWKVIGWNGVEKGPKLMPYPNDEEDPGGTEGHEDREAHCAQAGVFYTYLQNITFCFFYCKT